MGLASFQTGKSIWYGPAVMEQKEEWLFTLTETELEELAVAADQLANSGTDEKYLPLEPLANLDNFNLPNVLPKARELADKVQNGLGFFVWRGIPVETWTRRRTAAAFLIVGKCMGNLRSQNAKGHILGHVKNLGLASSDPSVRVYQTNERQTFHADSCDVVGLLCLKTAKSGGLSSIVSAGTIYNEMLTKYPESAYELLQPLPTDKRGEVPKGTLPYYNIPVYTNYAGHLSVKYQRQYIDSSQRLPEAPRLTEKQVAALNLFDSMADDPKLHFTMRFQPGDMQFLNNLTLLHDRSAFEDWAEPEKKRHLLRIWLAPPNNIPLPPVWAERYGSVTVGDRGGISIQGVPHIAPLEAV